MYKTIRIVLVLMFGVNSAVFSLQINASYEFHRPRRQSCQSSEFPCRNGQCISSYDKCDGIKHCSDGTDETASVCKAPGIECPSMSFECEYGACIYETLRCDNKVDCADGSDEKGCPRPGGSSFYQTSACSTNDFSCLNGQCISGYDICDGVKHCDDGSDESWNVCSDYECPPRSFKCTYGACLNPSLRCNGYTDCHDGSDEQGNCPKPIATKPVATRPPTIRPIATTSTTSKPVMTRPPYRPPPPTKRPTISTVPQTLDSGSCRLPMHPTNGAYVSPKTQCASNDPRPSCRNTPNSFVPSTWVLKYTCNSGYSPNKDTVYSFCENGIWQPSIDCIKLCPPLTSISVNVRCYYGGAEINCTLPMKPDTQATAECKPQYKPAYLPEYSSLACLKNGEWSYRLFYCLPECGLSSLSVPLISNGIRTKIGEYPWLAAIYRKPGQRWDQQCGGTLITTHIVVTAAHCLVNSELENKPLHPTEIKVGLGKYFRDYYIEETTSLIADVKEVVIPPQYSGSASQYAQDIGLLDLVISVQVTYAIMPACVDWSIAFTPDDNAQGMVAGWGRTSDGGNSSEVALSARLKFIRYSECLKRLTAGTKLLLTHDKFCAGNVDGSQVNKGDSGGGLTFLKDSKHFLIGVVSTRIPGFSLFLDITNREHSTWLEKEKTRLKQYHNE